MSNFWYQLDESFCSGTRSCECAGEIRVMVRNWGAPSLGGIYDNQKPFTQHSSNAGPAAFLNVKEDTKKMRAAWESFGDRRQITLCSKLSCSKL